MDIVIYNKTVDRFDDACITLATIVVCSIVACIVCTTSPLHAGTINILYVAGAMIAFLRLCAFGFNEQDFYGDSSKYKGKPTAAFVYVTLFLCIFSIPFVAISTIDITLWSTFSLLMSYAAASTGIYEKKDEKEIEQHV